jgi:membrane protein
MNTSSAPNRQEANDSLDQRSLAELLQKLSEQSSTLAQKEIELAKAEMAAKGKRIGIGAGAFGGAGLVGLYALGALTAAAILGLATAVTAWLSALIIGVAFAAVAGVLALTGKKKVEAGTPPVPEQALDSSKRDIETAKQSAKEGRDR